MSFLVKLVLPMLHMTMTYLISLIVCLQKQHKILDDVDALGVLLFEIACSMRSTLQSDFDEIEQLKENRFTALCSFADWFLACDVNKNNLIFVCSAG